MKYLLDANTIILLLSGTNERLHERVSRCTVDELAVSAIAFAEVALGSRNGKKPSTIAVDGLSGVLPVLPFDELAAREYARLPFRRGSYERLIAAHALALGLTLVTNNECDFADISRLTVEDWTAP